MLKNFYLLKTFIERILFRNKNQTSNCATRDSMEEHWQKWRAEKKKKERKQWAVHLHPRIAVRSVSAVCLPFWNKRWQPSRLKYSWTGRGYNSIGYLGGIDDGRLDALEDAERANVTTFIDFTTSKTWLYSSRSEQSAKTRMCCRTLFLYVAQ